MIICPALFGIFWPFGRDILTSEFDINGRRGEESVMNFILTYLNENCSSFEHPLDLPSLPSSIFAEKFTFSCDYYSITSSWFQLIRISKLFFPNICKGEQKRKIII